MAGRLVDGHWTDAAKDFAEANGRFARPQSSLRNFVTADGAPGTSGEGGFAAEAGRYHLYVSLACPWAHRALILRKLKGLEAMITVSVVHWHMAENGWTFEPGPGVIPDPVNHARYLYEVYTASDAHYSGKVTVPVLWDRKMARIVNNESSEIIRMFNSAFDRLGARPGDFYPSELRNEIDAFNTRIYETLNNGVYRAGFATTQSAYEEAVLPLFATLDWLEQILATRRFLCGADITEADWRLFTTLIRFDAVYFGHFKCNLHRIVDYPNLSGYLRDLYQVPGVAGTVDFDHIKRHYYTSHPSVNPTGIVPLGPVQDFTRPHVREGLAT